MNIVAGFGCNALVCLATWCVVVTDDGAGKVAAIFYTVGVFAMGKSHRHPNGVVTFFFVL